MRLGLTRLIEREPDLSVCGEADNAHSAIQAVADLSPDAAILDIALSGGDGIELVKNSLRAGAQTLHALQEAVERDVVLPVARLDALASETQSHEFVFSARRESEALRGGDGRVAGYVLHKLDGLNGRIEISAERIQDGLFKVRARVCNRTLLPSPDTVGRDEVMLRSMASTHAILSIGGAEFVSVLDPPPGLAEAASRCANQRTWPVLVGRKGERDCVLSSPIILYDYPEVAPESTGNLFDSTEIDELLTLRLLTLTEAEKAELRESDVRGRRILERAEALSSGQVLKLHGALRDADPATGSAGDVRPRSVRVCGVELIRGDRVRLKPGSGGDVFDIALAGRVAAIDAIEQDFEGRIHVAVVVDDDPGKDLGSLRLPGHRFFFSPAELEPVTEGQPHG